MAKSSSLITKVYDDESNDSGKVGAEGQYDGRRKGGRG